MKKYLLILTTLALLGGGCSKEEIPETTDGEGSVEFRTTTCSEVDSQTTRAQTSLPDNCKPSGNSFPVHQGGLRPFPDFVQHKAVKGFVLHTVLGTVLFPIGIIGLTGINLLRVLVVGVADSQ